MNSQFLSSPSFTISPRPSTICVCGVIGYAQITSGRHNATAWATASEPSICLSMHGSIDGSERELVGGARRRNVSRADFAGKFFLDRLRDRFEFQLPADRRESAEQRRIGQRTP